MTLTLPVEEVLDELCHALSSRHQAVLEAPPGAGKTTLVPLALLQGRPEKKGRIVVLEPRRLAARAAAQRMADLLGEPVGQTVGYRMRLDTRVGKNTRIEVVTEGVLVRLLQADPSLEGVDVVVFDEFHERNLDADLALSLCLKGRELFRGERPLELLVMSATLDVGGVAALLHDAPVVRAEGKMYPVEVIYGRASRPRERVTDRVTETLRQALRDNPDSSVLVFLPGQGEIAQVQRDLGDVEGIDVYPLYGNLSLEEQRRAVAPSTRPKVVLATNIAETSLTIEGVDVVVDSGLVREPVFDPNTAMTRLETRRISAASSIQRMGRAGRLRAGKCYRLWSASQQQALVPEITPEILAADLAPLAMQLLAWGVSDPAELDWLDPPPRGAWQQALDLLAALGATRQAEEGLVLTEAGVAMSSLPVHPRLAHLMIEGAAIGEPELATLVASFLSDRDPFAGDDPDIAHRIDILEGTVECPPRYGGWLHRTRELARQFRATLDRAGIARKAARLDRDQALAYLLACAYPDRIARQRQSGGYQLAGGRSAVFRDTSNLAKSRWLVVAEVGGAGKKSSDVIRSAVSLDPALLESWLSPLVHESTICEWDKRSGRFVAERRRSLGNLVLDREALGEVDAEVRQSAIIDYIRREGLEVLRPGAGFRQWQARVRLASEVADLPDLSDEKLLATMETWLAPWLHNVSRLQDLQKLNLEAILRATLSHEQHRLLDQLVPVRVKVPSGREVEVDYRQDPPVLAVKLQELFGAESGPAILRGQKPLMLHLLSPAGRPLQVTADLKSFWQSGYEAVRKEMRGRYPKHPWPENPLEATPTAHTKKRMQ